MQPAKWPQGMHAASARASLHITHEELPPLVPSPRVFWLSIPRVTSGMSPLPTQAMDRAISSSATDSMDWAIASDISASSRGADGALTAIGGEGGQGGADWAKWLVWKGQQPLAFIGAGYYPLSIILKPQWFTWNFPMQALYSSFSCSLSPGIPERNFSLMSNPTDNKLVREIGMIHTNIEAS